MDQDKRLDPKLNQILFYKFLIGANILVDYMLINDMTKKSHVPNTLKPIHFLLRS